MVFYKIVTVHARFSRTTMPLEVRVMMSSAGQCWPCVIVQLFGSKYSKPQLHISLGQICSPLLPFSSGSSFFGLPHWRWYRFAQEQEGLTQRFFDYWKENVFLSWGVGCTTGTAGNLLQSNCFSLALRRRHRTRLGALPMPVLQQVKDSSAPSSFSSHSPPLKSHAKMRVEEKSV